LEKAGWVSEHVCAEVPHRQFVFTIPKRLRIYFRFDRRLLGQLCGAAARTVITVYRAASGRPDAVPGMVGAIQTFGQLIHWHPHIHALVDRGGVPARRHISGVPVKGLLQKASRTDKHLHRSSRRWRRRSKSTGSNEVAELTMWPYKCTYCHNEDHD
jgi:hypothetical protein